MERGKRIDEIALPEPIIQQIQSSLNGKQAAQTSILSKSWHDAWLTSPNIDFDERHFRNGGLVAEIANRTMQRYKEFNIKIDKFSLLMKSTKGSCSRARELILKALKMHIKDLTFEFHPPNETFVLPDEVLGAETLIRLSLIGCTIVKPVDGKVSCSTLRSLSLSGVYIENDVIWDIISSCPLIEKLLLSECECVIAIETSTVARKLIKPLALACPFTTSFVFRNLKFLSLVGLNIDGLFTCDSLKFHCLVELTLSRCSADAGIQISSSSLMCLILDHMEISKAKFNFPNLHRFKFSGSSFPYLSFSTLSSRQWLSEISISCSSLELGSLWFPGLNRFLRKLSPSKIYLSIAFVSQTEIYLVGGIEDFSTPVVENLTLSVHSSSSVCSTLLNGLFWSFRPKSITQYWFPRSDIPEKANNELLLLLCKVLTPIVNQDCCIFFFLRDLEEVNVEVFEEMLNEWMPLPWNTLLDGSTTQENKREIRFQLRWREEPIDEWRAF